MTTFVDPDLDVNVTAAPRKPAKSATTLFDELKKDLNHPPVLKNEDFISVPGRNFDLRINALLDADQLEKWRVAATHKKSGKLDMVRWYSAVIAGQTKAIVTKEDDNGDREDVMDSEGEYPLHFRHAELREMLNALDSLGAVKEMFGRDANILKAGDQIMTICGYGTDDGTEDEDSDEDPFD